MICSKCNRQALNTTLVDGNWVCRSCIVEKKEDKEIMIILKGDGWGKK